MADFRTERDFLLSDTADIAAPGGLETGAGVPFQALGEEVSLRALGSQGWLGLLLPQ